MDHSQSPHKHVAETAPLHDPTDAWHDHSHDEPARAPHGEIGNPLLIMGVGVGLSLLVAVAVVVVDNFYRWYSSQHMIRSDAAISAISPAMETRAAKAQTLTQQTSSDARWIVIPAPDDKTPARTIAQLPIEEATRRVAGEYAARMGGNAITPGTPLPANTKAPSKPAAGSK